MLATMLTALTTMLTSRQRSSWRRAEAVLRAYDVAAVRAAEQALMARLPEGALMQRAAAGLAAHCARLLEGERGERGRGGVYGRRVVLLVGSGDNGGDTLYAGARLARRGARVDALLLVPEKAHANGLAALRAAGGQVAAVGAAAPAPALLAPLALLDDADLVLDGIVGIGGRGGLRPVAAKLVGRAEASGARIVAVDVPSGVDASAGAVEGACVRADLTVTFGALKIGLVVDPGATHAGAVELVDIGLDPELPDAPVTALEASDIAASLPRAAFESDKYRRGVLGIVAGSRAYTGAAVLACGGALRTGVGMARFVSDAHPAEVVRQRWPEAVVTEVAPGDGRGVLGAGRVQAWAIGPGIGTDQAARDVLAAVLSAQVPVVVDADALTLLSSEPSLLAGRAAPTLATPHAGELARLLGTERAAVESRRLDHVRRAAAELGVTVLLKGSTTLIANPDGGDGRDAREVRVNRTGTPALATAGSGDVLTGACGALLAAGLGPLDAGSVAAYLHGLAARLASRGGRGGRGGTAPITASDVLGALPDAIRRL
jgi:hydroxyethylthiazole kinase-like uncharacterized protein yjeF